MPPASDPPGDGARSVGPGAAPPGADELAGRISPETHRCLLAAVRKVALKEEGAREALAAAVHESFDRALGGADEPGGGAAGEGGHTPRDLARRLYGLLKFHSDDTKCWRHWQALAESADPRRDRDAAVLSLWRLLEGDPQGQAYVRGTFQSLTYHRHRLFDWFLGRYDLRRGRAVWKEGIAVSNAHLLLLVSVGAIAALRLWLWTSSGVAREPILRRPQVVLTAVAYALVAGLLGKSLRCSTAGVSEAVAVAVQSLVPRLAGAAAVGVLLLASSRDLLQFVVSGASAARVALLVGASYVYLLLEMSRRIHPLPGLWRLLLLGLDVSATAFAHGLALTLVAEPGLQSILGDQGAWGPWRMLNVTAFLSTIGLVVNLIWAEQPVTQPL
jgi:hypothetical protein